MERLFPKETHRFNGFDARPVDEQMLEDGTFVLMLGVWSEGFNIPDDAFSEPFTAGEDGEEGEGTFEANVSLGVAFSDPPTTAHIRLVDPDVGPPNFRVTAD